MRWELVGEYYFSASLVFVFLISSLNRIGSSTSKFRFKIEAQTRCLNGSIYWFGFLWIYYVRTQGEDNYKSHSKRKKIRILEEESSNDLQLLCYCWGWIFLEVNPHRFMKLEIYLVLQQIYKIGRLN